MEKKTEPEFEFERIVNRFQEKQLKPGIRPGRPRKLKDISELMKCPSCGSPVKGAIRGPRSGYGACTNNKCSFRFIA